MVKSLMPSCMDVFRGFLRILNNKGLELVCFHKVVIGHSVGAPATHTFNWIMFQMFSYSLVIFK